MSNKKESSHKEDSPEQVKPGPKYYLTRPDTPMAIKIATLQLPTEEKK